MPPEAVTFASVRSATSRSRSMFGPLIMPSRVTSVTTYRLQPASSRKRIVSNRSPPSLTQPRAASVCPRTSRPTATRSPYLAITRAVHSGFSSAAVPMFTRAAPASSAASSEASSRTPPDISMFTASPSSATIRRSCARLSPVPKAASRSTKWIHCAPASTHVRAASSGEP